MRSKREASSSLAQEDIERGFLGWPENGYLPHRDEPGLVQFVTFRLADAFPEESRSEWESFLKIENGRQRRIELEACLDKGRGACHLQRPEIARIVEDSLRFRQGEDYELRAWVSGVSHLNNDSASGHSRRATTLYSLVVADASFKASALAGLTS